MPSAVSVAPELDLTVRDAPLVGVKLSRIVMDRAGDLCFAPLYERMFTATFQASDKAVCASFGAHPAPNDACSCGFYAVSDLAELHRFAAPPPSAVFVQARFGGAVIEHDFGFRAQFQTIDSFALPASCGWCGTHPPVGLRPRRISRSTLRELVPVCPSCSTTRTLPLATVAARLGVHAGPARDFSHLVPAPPTRTRPLVAATLVALAALALTRSPFALSLLGLVPVVWFAHPRVSLRSRFLLEHALRLASSLPRFFAIRGRSPFTDWYQASPPPPDQRGSDQRGSDQPASGPAGA